MSELPKITLEDRVYGAVQDMRKILNATEFSPETHLRYINNTWHFLEALLLDTAYRERKERENGENAA